MRITEKIRDPVPTEKVAALAGEYISLIAKKGIPPGLCLGISGPPSDAEALGHAWAMLAAASSAPEKVYAPAFAQCCLWKSGEFTWEELLEHLAAWSTVKNAPLFPAERSSEGGSP